ncbi:nucleotide exchange factor GrpE [Halobacterium jilantaiense]|uniref:Protein GrpE n=1 Tax=Halobacterium jilantaiense TaxID=355548 RepID=A0A1I0NR78_9EURY|nr:nucleotide exchange factor GrpE [Halobacterium jilantaiense]SEW03393.1 molecular chaperone GrpE [Halobacterium jilantaiense]
MSEDAEHAAEAADADGTAAGDEEQAADAEDTLAERVRAAAGDDLGDEVADLEARVEELERDLDEAETEVTDLTERLQAKQAEFKNYKQRAKRKQEDIRERATEDLVERLLDVRDNLGRALDQDGDGESIREGVELTRKEFDRVLDSEGVSEIRPEAGDEVDATRHEVMMRVDSDHPEGTVEDVYRPGYEMAGKVLQTAQVTVSDGTSESDDDS